jgi:hypothetical protein
MIDSSRRIFLQKAGVGLATIGASGLVLRSDAVPTQEVNRDQVVIQLAQIKSETPAKTELKKVVSFPYGPFYKEGAPFRGKLSLPGEPGTQFVLSGRVWAFDTKQPLPGAVLDFWHVDMNEKYSNGTTDFRNRGGWCHLRPAIMNWRVFAQFRIDLTLKVHPISGDAPTSIWSLFLQVTGN